MMLTESREKLRSLQSIRVDDFNDLVNIVGGSSDDLSIQWGSSVIRRSFCTTNESASVTVNLSHRMISEQEYHLLQQQVLLLTAPQATTPRSFIIQFENDACQVNRKVIVEVIELPPE
jgi:hypothetical protein